MAQQNATGKLMEMMVQLDSNLNTTNKALTDKLTAIEQSTSAMYSELINKMDLLIVGGAKGKASSAKKGTPNKTTTASTTAFGTSIQWFRHAYTEDKQKILKIIFNNEIDKDFEEFAKTITSNKKIDEEIKYLWKIATNTPKYLENVRNNYDQYLENKGAINNSTPVKKDAPAKKSSKPGKKADKPAAKKSSKKEESETNVDSEEDKPKKSSKKDSPSKTSKKVKEPEPEPKTVESEEEKSEESDNDD